MVLVRDLVVRRAVFLLVVINIVALAVFLIFFFVRAQSLRPLVVHLELLKVTVCVLLSILVVKIILVCHSTLVHSYLMVLVHV